MDTATPSDDRPNIQIDDFIRPMTDEEYAEWIAIEPTGPNPGRDEPTL